MPRVIQFVCFVKIGNTIYLVVTGNDRVVEDLILDLLEWIETRERTYEEVMDAWRTSCPRLPVWEEANDRGLVIKDRSSSVKITPAGFALLELSGRNQAGR